MRCESAAWQQHGRAPCPWVSYAAAGLIAAAAAVHAAAMLGARRRVQVFANDWLYYVILAALAVVVLLRVRPGRARPPSLGADRGRRGVLGGRRHRLRARLRGAQAPAVPVDRRRLWLAYYPFVAAGGLLLAHRAVRPGRQVAGARRRDRRDRCGRDQRGSARPVPRRLPQRRSRSSSPSTRLSDRRHAAARRHRGGGGPGRLAPRLHRPRPRPAGHRGRRHDLRPAGGDERLRRGDDPRRRLDDLGRAGRLRGVAAHWPSDAGGDAAHTDDRAAAA